MNPTPPPLLTPDSPAADHRPYTNPAGQTIAFQKGAMELGRNGWTTEELLNQGIAADLEASHPKMGFLVREAAERSPALLRQKRT